MPAVQLTRLNAEVKYLARQFGEPERFNEGLVDLFERYASWSFRSGELTRQNIQIPQYHLPQIVTQKLRLAVQPYCLKDPEYTMRLAKNLWRGSYFEVRQFAITILTLLPLTEPQQYFKIIQDWLSSESEMVLKTELLQIGCSRLRVEHPQIWLDQIESWLNSSNVADQVIGLRALTISLNDTAFKFLPNIFRLSTDLLIESPSHLATLLQELVEAMIRRSPSETSFFLQQLLVRGGSRETSRIIRKNLTLLPKHSQKVLRVLLADANSPSTEEY
jgi:hypothetical protein